MQPNRQSGQLAPHWKRPAPSFGARRAAVLMLALIALTASACGPTTKHGNSSDNSTSTTSGSGGAGSTAGVTDTSISVGIHAPLTLGSVDVEKLLKLRALTTAYWDAVNDAGGINGRKVEPVVVDDGYDAGRAVQACRELLSKKVLFVVGTAGADQIAACGQTVLTAGVPYVSLGQGEAGLVGKPGYFALTITYDKQAGLQAQYIVHKLHGDTSPVALIRFNSATINGAHDDFTTEFQKLTGHRPAVDDAVDKNPNAAELSSECLKLKQANVKVVSILASSLVATALGDACSSTGYKPQYVGWANTGGCVVDPALLGTKSLDGCLNFQSVHQPKGSQAPIVKQCHDAWSKYAKAASGDFPTGGESICGLFDIIREALAKTGRDLGRSSFTATLSHLKYDDGFVNPIDFNGGDVGSASVLVTRADAATLSQVEVISDWQSKF